MGYNIRCILQEKCTLDFKKKYILKPKIDFLSKFSIFGGGKTTIRPLMRRFSKKKSGRIGKKRLNNPLY